jgi:hypothetical protein
MAALKLDQHVDVAVSPNIRAENGPKERKPPNVVTPAEVRQTRPVDVHGPRHRDNSTPVSWR